jgi:hypothetical protein
VAATATRLFKITQPVSGATPLPNKGLVPNLRIIPDKTAQTAPASESETANLGQQYNFNDGRNGLPSYERQNPNWLGSRNSWRPDGSYVNPPWMGRNAWRMRTQQPSGQGSVTQQKVPPPAQAIPSWLTKNINQQLADALNTWRQPTV